MPLAELNVGNQIEILNMTVNRFHDHTSLNSTPETRVTVTARGTVQTVELNGYHINGNEVELISSAGHIYKLPMNEIALDRLVFPINAQVTDGVIVETDPDMFHGNFHGNFDTKLARTH